MVYIEMVKVKVCLPPVIRLVGIAGILKVKSVSVKWCREIETKNAVGVFLPVAVVAVSKAVGYLP